MKRNILKYLLLLAMIFCFIPNYVSAKSSPYVIKVERKGVVNVLKKTNGSYKTKYKMWCSCGLNETPTPKGTFYTSDTYRWHRMKGDVYCQYVTRIHKGICFHSTLYKENKNRNSLIASSYNNLGHKASHGCVRLRVLDAKRIYNICKKYPNTKVVISDKKLKRPQPIGTISWDATRDPSDK